ncbi:FUSC family protein [Sulfobacillus harzensis]|uniref:Aromatic acid exporter family protein n=1 Tax=Sulfobacillus harzensis TaxID=2729629 RepID=A0A7Y0Q1Q0_9FIRM|nr:FUSC family protein [Sulfobacillus harzensis]NMP22323.1 aromatic acid exporter family protein [Sulfobacillus harzensis]
MVRWSKLPWDKLENWGVSLQAAKTALAAGLAWGLSVWIFHAPRPYFAPLAAILCVQATVAESVSRGVQRILGVIGGIFLALFFTHLVGLHAWSIAVLVFVAMAAARRLRLGSLASSQVAISALMVLAIGSQVKGYAWSRALDTALGAAVAILVSALVWPPDFTPDATEALRILAMGLSGVMEGIQNDLVRGLEPEEANRRLKEARAIESGLHQARQAIHRAETSLRWNPWHRGDRGKLKELRHALTVLDHTMVQVRGIARTLFVTLDRDVSKPAAALPTGLAERLGSVLALMGEALKSYAYLIRRQDQSAALRLEAMVEAAKREREVLLQEAGTLPGGGDGARFLDIAAVLVDLDKMSQDLMVSARLIVPIVHVQP